MTAVKVFASREEAEAFASTQAGKLFRRYRTVGWMQRQTPGWREAYDAEQAAKRPGWATRQLQRWQDAPQDTLPYEDVPADVVYERGGQFYVGVALVEEQVEYFDAPQRRLVLVTEVRTPAVVGAVRVPGDTVGSEPVVAEAEER